ncbi:MAG: hypothetical protein AB7S50_03555 [Bacteroidales bacterium]
MYLYSGKLITAETINRESPYFTADSLRIHENEVKFIKFTKGRFANLKQLYNRKNSFFVPRVISGKINLYGRMITVQTSNGGWENNKFRAARSQTISFMFYNKGYEDIKPLKYKNLLVDMADNNESLKILNEYKTNRRIELGVYAFSAAIFIPSTIGFFDKNKMNDDISIVGICCSVIIAYVNQIVFGNGIKFEKLKKAIETYNN